MGARARRVRGHRVGDVVRRRPSEHRDELRPPPRGAPPGRRRGGLPRRRRHAARAHVRRAVSRDDAARRGARRARRRARRPRRDLHADVPRGRRGLACVRARRGGAGADLLGVRRARDRAAARGLRREGRDLRGRLVPARPPAADARDGRRGRRRRCGDRVEPGARRVARARAATAGNAACAAGRLGAPVPPHVHVRHDGSAEGRAARPRRLSRLDRPRGRVPDGRERGRRRPLRHGHGLDHGAVDRRRAPARSARRSSSPRAPPTGPTTGSGGWSSRSA